jgi:hypothetical protein
VTVYDGSAWQTDPHLQDQAVMLNTFFEYLTGSSYLDGLAQYRVPGNPPIGHGTFVADDFVGGSPGNWVDDETIQTLINSEIDAYDGVPVPNGETLYVVFTPPGTAVSYGNQSSTTGLQGYVSIVYDYCGYPTYEYAVIPYPGSPNVSLGDLGWTVNPRNPAPGGTPVNAFQQLTAVGSAELADAVTYSWFDGSGRTVSDLGRAFPSDGANPYYFLDDYMVQELWSNQANDGQGGAVPPAGAATSGGTLSTTAGPTPLDPSTSTGNDPRFDWDPVAGADWYNVAVTDLSTGETVIRRSDVATTTLPASVPLGLGQSYQWQVRAFSDDGVMGQFSAPLTFSAEARPATLPYTADFSGGQLDDTWVDLAGGFDVSAGGATALGSALRNLAVLDGVAAADESATAAIDKLPPGQTVGLVVRFTDPGSFYLGTVTHIGNGFSANVFRLVNGLVARLAHVVLPETLFTGSGTLTFEAVGTSLRLILIAPGALPTLVAQVEDRRLTGPGTVGIRASVGARFGSFTAAAISPTPATISPPFVDPLVPTADGQLDPYWQNQVGDFAMNPAGYMAAARRGTPNLAALFGVATANVTESVTVTDLGPGQTAGLVARAQGPDDRTYDFGGVTRAGNQYAAIIDRAINGHVTRLAHVPLRAAVFDGTGTIAFEAVGTSLRLILTDPGSSPVVLAFARDERIATPGSVGIRGTVGAQFSNFTAAAVNLTSVSASPSFSDLLTPGADGQLGMDWSVTAGDFAGDDAGLMSAAGERRPDLAVLNGPLVSDATESVDIVALGPDQTAALVAAYEDPRNYDFGGITRVGDRYEALIDRVQAGRVRILAHTALAAGAFSGSGAVVLQVTGSDLQLSLQDGGNPPTVVATALDAVTAGPGGLGLRGSGGGQFRNYQVSG